MRERRWLLLTLHGILLTLATTGALKATRPKFKIATSSTTTTTTALPSTSEQPDAKENEDSVETTTVADTNATTGHTLTGIPQIDYIWDPNLPRELNGYNLSDYPFYNSIPTEEIDFKCDGLHDGFYASVPHKCQVYHHCLYGTRYDFLCANFTAFDQKTFICHFVSEVDCANSKKYWHRNDALYKATTSSTSTTSTTPRPSTTTTTTTSAPSLHDGPRDRDGPRRRRPYQRWRPAFDYYDEDYYDDEFDRGRLYGYDRLYDDYDNRKYRRDRDRDRDVFERNLRDRTDRPPRAERDRDRDGTPLLRDRYPMRTGARRDPMRPGRDPMDEDRPRVRGQDQGFRYRDPEGLDYEDRRLIDRPRMGDERRTLDSKRYKDDYDDKEAPAVAASNGNTEGLVKPAAPLSSVYARPRTPPKIRRPVPLSEQDKYSYKSKASSSSTSSSTSLPPSAIDEPRSRRPADVTDIDYYDDELLEEMRPRRPYRRRPNFRERDRDFYDARDPDRPYRPRYRDDDLRLRKYPERSRDRYYDRERTYDRGRDRMLDRGNKDFNREVLPERPLSMLQPHAHHKPIDEFDREPIRVANLPTSSKENEEPVSVNRVPSTTTPTSTTTSSTTTTTTTTTVKPETTRPEKATYKSTNLRIEFPPSSNSDDSEPNDEENQTTVKELSSKYWRPTFRPAINKQQTTLPAENERYKVEPPKTTTEEYLSEYYDEDETVPPPSSPPSRPTFRVVKRPFLPSRGGNPNPRGLLPVGMKASALFVGRQDEGRSIIHDNTTYPVTTANYKNINDAYLKTLEPYKEHRYYKEKTEEEKKVYNAYKVIQPDVQSKKVTEPAPSTIPTIHVSSTGNAGVQELRESHKPLPNWTIEEPIRTISPPSGPARPNNQRTHNQDFSTQNPYNTPQYNDEVRDSNNQGYRVKQRINEVSNSHLQDIPESEYDVTLNDALTPTLNQETSLPSGFALPVHRQNTGRDALLQPSENEYEYSKPVSQYQEPKQNSFVPSTRFVPPSVNRNERPKAVYYRTPETIHVAPSIQQYRHNRGSWHDYTGF